MCKRPYASAADMNASLIANTNKLVKQADKLYILGDLSYWKGDDRYINLVRWRNQIRCENVFVVPGNHDFFFPPRVTVLPPIYELQVDGKNLVALCHYAMRTWNKSHRGSLHAFGHSHAMLEEDGSLSEDVGVDAVAKRHAGSGPLLPEFYRPISLTEFEADMELKKAQILLTTQKGQ